MPPDPRIKPRRSKQRPGHPAYREDESRTRGVFMRENLAWLYRFTLSLLKQCKNKNSVAMNRRRCGWNEDTLLEILTGAKS